MLMLNSVILQQLASSIIIFITVPWPSYNEWKLGKPKNLEVELLHKHGMMEVDNDVSISTKVKRRSWHIYVNNARTILYAQKHGLKATHFAFLMEGLSKLLQSKIILN
ncbi:hypothetical protein SO802_020496 [Lithocarpus litseifolius]|uniref:Uncharacterized protein n=1 Tax=Lithocarpus litseifolius TaxID=425828 RepID=A0AAW2CBZ9_9ROSI